MNDVMDKIKNDAAISFLKRAKLPTHDHNISAILSGRPDKLMTDSETWDAEAAAREERQERA